MAPNNFATVSPCGRFVVCTGMECLHDIKQNMLCMLYCQCQGSHQMWNCGLYSSPRLEIITRLPGQCNWLVTKVVFTIVVYQQILPGNSKSVFCAVCCMYGLCLWWVIYASYMSKGLLQFLRMAAGNYGTLMVCWIGWNSYHLTTYFSSGFS